MKLSLFLILIILTGASTQAVGQDAAQNIRDLYARCTSNMQTRPQVAYDACKEYLQKYPNDDERRLQFVKTWVGSYDQILLYTRSLASIAANGSTANWFIYEPDLGLEIPEVVEKEGNYPVEIVRTYKDAREAEMLRKAEAVYPSADELIKRVEKNPTYWAKNLPSDNEPIWWEGGNDNVRLTFVITTRAVRYYYDLSQGLRGNPGFVPGFPMVHTSLKYTAAIKHYDEYTHAQKKFKNVYVADLNLEWSNICGGLCGMGFKRNKLVVMDSNGEVLALFLDAPGNSGMWVS